MFRKKLIEVALPLEAINKASAKEKSIRHGHPSTMHLWWARRPLAACRAVLFSSLVDDPSSHPDQFPTEADQEKERERLFGIIERLVLWENVDNKTVLDEARAEILRSTDGHPPVIYDPFCGGGSIPLEAQRLGLEAHASDLNPVAVLITKALIELPPKFSGSAPINPESRMKGLKDGAYPGVLGLAADVRYYGEWIKNKAFERIGEWECVSSRATRSTTAAWGHTSSSNRAFRSESLLNLTCAVPSEEPQELSDPRKAAEIRGSSHLCSGVGVGPLGGFPMTGAAIT